MNSVDGIDGNEPREGVASATSKEDLQSSGFDSPIQQMAEDTVVDPAVSKAPLLAEVERLYREYLRTTDERVCNTIRRQLVGAARIEMKHVVRHKRLEGYFPNFESDIDDACQFVWERVSPISLLKKWNPERKAGLRTFLWTNLTWRLVDFLRNERLITRGSHAQGKDSNAGLLNVSAAKGASGKTKAKPQLVRGLDDDEMDRTRDPAADTPVQPESAARRNELVAIVDEAFAILPEKYRRVADWMRDAGQLDEKSGEFNFGNQAEGARKLGMDDATFNRYVRRIKRQLMIDLGSRRGELI